MNFQNKKKKIFNLKLEKKISSAEKRFLPVLVLNSHVADIQYYRVVSLSSNIHEVVLIRYLEFLNSNVKIYDILMLIFI